MPGFDPVQVPLLGGEAQNSSEQEAIFQAANCPEIPQARLSRRMQINEAVSLSNDPPFAWTNSCGSPLR